MSIRFILSLGVIVFAFQWCAVLGQESDESTFLHVLIIGDTIDSGVGKSVEKDITALKELFENGIPQSKRNITVLADDFLTPNSLFDAIDQLKVDANDSLLLYYCGHGIVDEDDKHFFILPTGKVQRSKVREAMQKKNPRLCVLFSDCCAVLEPSSAFRAFAPPFKTVNSELMRYLFFRSQGLVDVNSARSGEVAFCSDFQGGLFTERFCNIFDRPTSELIQADSGVPSWSTVLEKITEMLIPSEAEVKAPQFMDASQQLEIEKTRGIRVFRGKKEPNQPVQHPVTFSALPAASYEQFPTGDNTLGFTYRVIPGKEIQVDTVVPGSMALWNGLEKGDSILGFERQRFDLTNVQEVPVPPNVNIKPRATRLDANFDFDAFLLSSMPVASYGQENKTPGWMKAFVQKSSSNRIINIPLNTSKSIKKKDSTTLTPEEVREMQTPYFWQLSLREDRARWICFSDILPDGSALVVWGDDPRNKNRNCSFDRMFPDGTRKNLYQYQATYSVNQATLDSNGKVRAFLTVGGKPQLLRQDESPDVLPDSVSKFFFFPNDTAVFVSDKPRFVFIWEYNKFIEAPPVPTNDNLRVPPRMLECAQEGRFFVHALPETGQMLTIDDKEIALWNCTDTTKLKQVSSKQILPLNVLPTEFCFCSEKDLLVYTYSSQGNPRLDVWNLREGAQHVRTMTGYFRNIRVNSTGTRMLASLNEETILWNLNDGAKIGVIRVVMRGENSVSFSPDGKYLAGFTKGWYGEAAMLWDAETGRHVKNLGKKEDVSFRSLRFAPDGKSVSLLSEEGTLQVVEF